MQTANGVESRYGLANHGIINTGRVYWNLAPASLVEQAVLRGEGELTDGGTIAIITAPYTGRSPNDKFITREPSSQDDIWWGKVNQPMEEAAFNRLLDKMLAYFQGHDLFVKDVFAAADPQYRLRVRVVSELAVTGLFVHNMFLRPTAGQLADFVPDFLLLQAPHLHANPSTDGTRSEAFVVINFARKIVLIGGTSYAGEVKKSIFTVMNYLMTKRNVMPMHCSANIGPQGDTALFFGLSGTGKTTLSADPSRALIGDDEHGWSERGTFNFEGGCYAKVINLSPTGEPDIYATTRMFGTLLENVVVDPVTRALNLDSADITENTRASYPIDFIKNIEPEGCGGHPKNIFFLAADAFGVLPPIAKLTPEQAMYHFLSGYTAKLAGTERGVAEPTATFSACFGAPFLPMHPAVYAEMLRERIKAHGTAVWLVNTGWTGGPYGVGHRMSLAYTRALLHSALEGVLAGTPTMETDPVFGLHMPTCCADVPDEVLRQRDTWRDKAAYDVQARKLAAMFQKNFVQFADQVAPEVLAAGPHGV
jgi:phosphoenolpyruvate carboxykinase (ATP)